MPGYCEQIIHVEETGLPIPAKDIDIWSYAQAQGFTIATNDEDFLNLLLSKGYPPKLILFRTGNQRTKVIVELLKKHQNEIQELNQKKHIGVLEIFDLH